MTNRREFLVAAGAAAVAGCQGKFLSRRVEPTTLWSALIHLGMNEWNEVPQRKGWKNLTDPVLANGVAEQYDAADHVRFDESVWSRVCDHFVRSGVNQVVIDLGEGVAYPSHPELGVKGAWSPDKLRAEVRRIRSLGMEPIPKLNLSTTHDLWLGPYHRMVSTSKYYQVVRELIADACEIFENPRYVHLGMDEEVPGWQYGQSLVVVRQGDLWWHDLLFFVEEVESHGARAWVWSDYLRRHERADFLKRMPKSVLQSPWWYKGDLNDPTYLPAKSIIALAELGYDVVPCSSNCYDYPNALPTLVDFCKTKYDPAHVIGFQMAPWLEMKDIFEKRWCEGADQIPLAQRRWGA